MLRIPKQWMDAIVYIYATGDQAQTGARAGATGFIVSMPPEDESIPRELGHHYVVTNDHVVARRPSVALRMNLTSGGFDVLTIYGSEWREHPDGDDLVVSPLRFGVGSHKYAAINRGMMLTREMQEHWDVGPGDEVFFIGRYVDIEGRAQNAPVMRTGIIAAYPAEPIHQPERGHDQVTVLVEARSLSGFSGSPVFVVPSPHLERSAELGGTPVVRILDGAPCYLLGIDWGHHPWPEQVMDPATKKALPQGYYVRGNSGMMMVVPADRLISLLETDPELVTMRREVEANHRRSISESPVDQQGD